MPRKPGRRRGHGWSRLRSPGASAYKRKREAAELGDYMSDESSSSSRMVIGTENEDRWNKLRNDLGFNTDPDFVTYLLDLAENKGLETDLPSTAAAAAAAAPPQESTQNPMELSSVEEHTDEPEINEQIENPSYNDPATRSLPGTSQMSLIMVCEDRSD